MALFFISIPLMLVAVGVAVVPLIVMSRNEVRHLARQAEQRLERHAHVHLQLHGAEDAATTEHEKPERARARRWHEPVLLETR
jgi:hypothetical protein